MANHANRWLVAALLALLPATHALADITRTVRVDCTRGQSVNAALRTNADQLIVEITGKCREAVVVSRSGVVLRGTDPALDGLIGPVGDFVTLLDVQGAFLGSSSGPEGVALENLSLSGSAHCGLLVVDSSIRLTNCLIADNNTGGGCGGANITQGSSARIVDTTFLRNGLATVESSVSCRNCTFSEFPFAAFIVTGGGGHGTLASSTINGGFGAAAVVGGTLQIVNTNITVTNRAINVEQGGAANVIGGTLSGQIIGQYRGIIRLDGTTQTTNPFGNELDQGTFLSVNGGALAGTTRFDRFSQGSVSNGTALGSLFCSAGADVKCDGSETKVSSSCGLCP